MATQENDQIIEDFMDGQPRAAEWRAMRQALSERLNGLRQTRAAEKESHPEGDQKALDTQIASLEKQLAALKTEEVVAEFVENSLHVALARGGAEEEGNF